MTRSSSAEGTADGFQGMGEAVVEAEMAAGVLLVLVRDSFVFQSLMEQTHPDIQVELVLGAAIEVEQPQAAQCFDRRTQWEQRTGGPPALPDDKRGEAIS